MHCFPSFQDNACVQDDLEKETCRSFQPLYGCDAATASQTGTGKNKGDTFNKPPDPITAARGIGFEAGFCAGAGEACETVKQSLKPDLESFLAAFEDLVAYQSLVAETASQSVLELATAMAELIMGTPPTIDLLPLDSLRVELETEINAAYGATLTFHPSPLKALHQAFACSQLQWPQHPVVKQVSDEKQSEDEVTVQLQHHSFEFHTLDMLDRHLQEAGPRQPDDDTA